MNNKHTDPRRNHLLAMLPPDEYEHLLPALEKINFHASEVLNEPHKKSRYAYFPVDGAVSLYYPMDHGVSAGIAMIGNEGMCSIVPVLGGEGLPYMAVVETAGYAYRLDVKVLQRELERSENLRHLLLLYVQSLFVQIAQMMVCGRHHTLRQQLCLHLLLMQDRMLSHRLSLTQQTIAHMLGVRRESVSKVAGELRDDGVIDYRRGRIAVLDRAALEAACCECYGVISAGQQDG
jgi:CRP-like cAMP-binding protein